MRKSCTQLFLPFLLVLPSRRRSGGGDVTQIIITKTYLTAVRSWGETDEIQKWKNREIFSTDRRGLEWRWWWGGVACGVKGSLSVIRIFLARTTGSESPSHGGVTTTMTTTSAAAGVKVEITPHRRALLASTVTDTRQNNNNVIIYYENTSGPVVHVADIAFNQHNTLLI